jgi:hypothetical protein
MSVLDEHDVTARNALFVQKGSRGHSEKPKGLACPIVHQKRTSRDRIVFHSLGNVPLGPRQILLFSLMPTRPLIQLKQLRVVMPVGTSSAYALTRILPPIH